METACQNRERGEIQDIMREISEDGNLEYAEEYRYNIERLRILIETSTACSEELGSAELRFKDMISTGYANAALNTMVREGNIEKAKEYAQAIIDTARILGNQDIVDAWNEKIEELKD